ncbi:sugar ABC transporter permease [Paenibacillus thalictri]|uniref:Sugar ABC transporter permease n=2 Tax=Paenibacillus thalictri TaxID=2527873 RepID=A0A4Q9DWK2_9BACL|nr:sugar ABC transporter permease [Paenibacillus thalictri]TBL81419.1 sugar ABC transporter permease [Paenibacillus thalictri]
MLGVAVFFLIPALFSLYLVFTNWNFLKKTGSFVGLDNFRRLFADELLYTSLKNTLIFLASVPVSIFLAFLAALVLNWAVFFKKTLRAMFFLPYITSGVAVAFVWMLLFHPKLGPINEILKSLGIVNPPGWLADMNTSMYAIDIIWIWFMLGYNMIIYLAALQEISPDLMEAARIDGARTTGIVRHVILPLVSPTTFLLLVTGFIMTIKTFGMIQAVTQGGPGNSTTILSLFVYRTAFRYYEMGYASAISWILFAIILLITFVQWFGQKRWVHY